MKERKKKKREETEEYKREKKRKSKGRNETEYTVSASTTRTSYNVRYSLPTQLWHPTTLRAGGTKGRFPEGTIDFSLLLKVLTGFTAHRGTGPPPPRS